MAGSSGETALEAIGGNILLMIMGVGAGVGSDAVGETEGGVRDAGMETRGGNLDASFA